MPTTVANARDAVERLRGKLPSGDPNRTEAEIIRDAMTELSDRLDAMENIIRVLAAKAGISSKDVSPTGRGMAPPTGHQAWVLRILGS